MYMNQKHTHRIQKYLDSCFGSKRHINYNASGLYTQAQIKKIIHEQTEKTKLRISQMKEISGVCTAEQLKEYFKMKVQLYDYTFSIPTFEKQVKISKWLPLVIAKNTDKFHPLALMVEINGQIFAKNEY